MTALDRGFSPRLQFLDALRGLAVIWMVIFHFFYDLRTFNVIDWDFNSGFWYGFPRFIAFTFLFCVGLSLYYGHSGGFKKKAFIERSAKLFIAALLISIGTYVAFPNGWIYFGTLHCIFLGSILGIWFVNHRILAFVLMIAMMFSQYVLGYDIQWVSSITNKYSMDFIPIYPWFWVILLGIVVAPLLKNLSILSNIHCPQFLRWLGKHSLKIYLFHQPILFGSIFALKELKILQSSPL
jgi:uncharacterized membrane protein